MKMALGIDPGLGGALVLTDGRAFIEVRKMPIIDVGGIREICYPDVRALLLMFDDLAKHDVHVFLERAVPFAMGTKSAFNYGRGFAALEIAIAEVDLPMTMVEANRWTKQMHQGIKKDLKPKAKSLIALKRLFPKLAQHALVKGKIHDGIVDAILIAGYGLLTRNAVIEDF